MKNNLLFIFLFVTCVNLLAVNQLPDDEKSKPNFAFVTYVSNINQFCQVKVLIKSIREFGDKYKSSPIYVVLSGTSEFSTKSLDLPGVFLLIPEIDSVAINYPLAIKAYAAAQVEKLIKDNTQILAWFDPETIVFGPLDYLNLNENFSVALRPVFLRNKIGLGPDEQLNSYWKSIYSETSLDYSKVPFVETIGDEKKIRSYFNFEIFSVNPKLGIFQEWAKILTKLLKDKEYQSNTCTGFLQKLFFHQAVLSAVIVSKVERQKIKWLPLSCGYPINLHNRLSINKKNTSLNNVSCAIIEDVWVKNPAWLEMFSADESLKKWLIQTYNDFVNCIKEGKDQENIL